MIADFNEFKSQVQHQNVVQIERELVLDVETALSIYMKLSEYKTTCFLEGANPGSQRYQLSYLGIDPYLTLRCDGATTHLSYANGHSEVVAGNFYDIIEDQILTVYSTKNAPFKGGLMGYMTYECAGFLEHISFPPNRELGLPLAHLMLPQTVIVIDNDTHKVQLIQSVFVDDAVRQNPQAAYTDALAKLERVVSKISGSLPVVPTVLDFSNIDVPDEPLVSDFESFLNSVTTCQDYILRGHIFQIQVSRRAKAPYAGDPLHLYRYLRYTNPSPFMFFVRFDETYMLGSSPEILVGVQDGIVQMRPLAGTRKRYSSTQTEDQIVAELLSDEKERAEHIMLVDLARNDVGRSCVPGTVAVNDLMTIEKYRHVVHIVSDVTGELKPECSSLDAFKYGFPAGTVTGSPKVRAMEIISELESTQREFYAGSVVFFDFENNLKSTLVIRSLLVKNGEVVTQAAAGIVADSKVKQEFKETNNKMKSALQAITLFGDKHT